MALKAKDRDPVESGRRAKLLANVTLETANAADPKTRTYLTRRLVCLLLKQLGPVELENVEADLTDLWDEIQHGKGCA